MDTSTTHLTKEQYAERKVEITRLRHEERMSIQQIADVFGVSRQRIVQILNGNTGGWLYNKFQDTLRDPAWLEKRAMLTNDEVAELLGASSASVGNYRRDVFHGQKGYSGRNVTWAKIIKGILEDRFAGLSMELLPYTRLGNLSVTGDKKTANLTVRVTSFKRTYPYLHPKGPMYSFSLMKRTRLNGTVDFVVCVIEPTEDFFVIPAEVIGDQDRINMTWPTSWASGKWQRYHDRFDLIAKFCKL